MAEGNFLVISKSEEDIEAAFRNGIISSNTGDQLLESQSSRMRSSACLGPYTEDTHTLIVAARGCAGITCKGCDQEVCAGCDTNYVLDLDSGEAMCSQCAAKSIWDVLNELQHA